MTRLFRTKTQPHTVCLTDESILCIGAMHSISNVGVHTARGLEGPSSLVKSIWAEPLGRGPSDVLRFMINEGLCTYQA